MGNNDDGGPLFVQCTKQFHNLHPIGRVQITGGRWIYVVDESGKFAVRRPIKIGRQNPQFYEVTDGLASGEKVIISGYELFGDNEKLILNE